MSETQHIRVSLAGDRRGGPAGHELGEEGREGGLGAGAEVAVRDGDRKQARRAGEGAEAEGGACRYRLGPQPPPDGPID